MATAKKKVSNAAHSSLLLNMKDINNAKGGAMNSKMDNKARTIDASLEKYNNTLMKALEAPAPNITLHYNEVLLRAVPIEVKSRSGIILGLHESDYKTADRLERLSEAISQTQEILMVGGLVTKEEQEAGLRPGRICKFRLDRFRTISDRHQTGMVETEYTVPSETIGEYKYLIIDKRDIIFTRDKVQDTE